ncbi:MAG: oligosaccharide flippase family protein, partial [Candidatus Diapherotrites archaeon]|nr:oligosaccharide flippase family protein [Candidatus Diapherotrites archaeon]
MPSSRSKPGFLRSTINTISSHETIKEVAKNQLAKLKGKSSITMAKLRDKSSLTRQFLENLSFRMLANMLMKGVSFLLILWLTRVLTSDDFGLYSFAISLASLFAVFGNLGVTGALLKVVPEKLARDDKKGAASWILGGLKLLTFGSLAIFLFLFITSPYL